MNNLLKIGIASGISIVIYYCCKDDNKKQKVKFNNKPEIIKPKIKELNITEPNITEECITEPIISIKYDILNDYKISERIKLTKIDLKEEPQIIDYYKLKSPIKKDEKWEIIS